MLVGIYEQWDYIANARQLGETWLYFEQLEF